MVRFERQRWSLFMSAAFSVLLAACSSGDSPDPVEPEPDPDVFSGQVSASATADIYVSDSTVVTMAVTNQDGQPAAGQSVVFAVTAGSAQVSGGPSWTTGSDGRASTVVRSDDAGSVTVSGYLGTSASGTAEGSVELAFIADVLSGLLSVSTDGDLRMSVEPVLSYTVTNQNGDPVEGESVTFEITGGSGTATLVGGPTEVTNEDGTASVSVAAVEPGTIEVRAYLGQDSDGPNTRETLLTFATGLPAALQFVEQPTLTLPGLEFLIDPVVAVVDDDGFILDDVELTVELSVTPGLPMGGELSATTVDGLATFTGVSIDAIWAGFRLTATNKELGSFESRPISSMYRDSFSFDGNTPCMVTEQGQVMCWGTNVDRLIGESEEQFVRSPAEIPDGGRNYSNVHVGRTHACGLVGTEDHARCWGAGEFLGNPDAPEFYGSLPLPVQPTHNFDILEVGEVTSCARVEFENFQCWGRNDLGQMGDGTQTSDWGLLRPGLRAFGLDFDQVSLGPNNGCAISVNEDLYCWGESDRGVVGNNYSGSIPQLNPAIIGYEHKWRRVAVGTHSACAITTEHELYCWGWNRHGMLALNQGDADVIAQAPQATSFTEPVLDISLSNMSACAVLADSRMICWGSHFMGQGDNRNTGENLYEVDVPEALSNFSIGQGVGCLIDHEAAAHCFGSNLRGAIGDPAVPLGPDAVPLTPVVGGHRFITSPAAR